MAKLLVVNNPAKKKKKKKKKNNKYKKKLAIKKKIVKKPKAKSITKPASEGQKMAKKKKQGKKKTKSIANTSGKKKRSKPTRRRSGGGGNVKGLRIMKNSILPAIIGGSGAVALDVVLAMAPLPPAFRSGPAKLLIKGGAAVAGGMALSAMVDKKVGQSFMLGALTLLAADLTKMAVSRAFPDLALGEYYDDDMQVNEYMSEYMSGGDSSDLGYMSTGPIVGALDYSDDYEQDGMSMDYSEGELVELDEF